MKNLKQRLCALLFAVTLIGMLGLTGCSNSDTKETPPGTEAPAATNGTESQTGGEAAITYPAMQIDMACNNTGSPDEALLLKFAELIEERSGGNIKAVVFAGTLGSELEIVEQIRANTVHMYVSATSTISTYAPEYNTFSVPYLYSNNEQLMKSWTGSIGDGLRANYEAAGMYTSENTLFIRGMRELTTNKLVKTVDDVKGLKLRLPSTAEWVTVWSAMGANIATISSSEVFSALQTGVVDAQENPIISNYNKGLQEVQKYTIMTDHIVDILPVIYSKGWFDGLDANTQELVTACIDEATEWANQYCVDVAMENTAEMEKAGMEFINVDTSSFKAVAMSCLKELSANWADGVYDQLIKDIG